MSEDNASPREVAEWWSGFGTGLLFGGPCVLVADGSAGRDGTIALVLIALGFAARAASRWLTRRKVEVSDE